MQSTLAGLYRIEREPHGSYKKQLMYYSLALRKKFTEEEALSKFPKPSSKTGDFDIDFEKIIIPNEKQRLYHIIEYITKDGVWRQAKFAKYEYTELWKKYPLFEEHIHEIK